MVVGTVLALIQTDMKRMLAYSSIAHAGFLLTGVLGLQGVDEVHDGQITSLQAVLFYLVAYGFATLGAFAVVGLVRDSARRAVDPSARWAGLGKQSPVVAGVFALFLLRMAGIPLTSGLHRASGRSSRSRWRPARGRSSLVGVLVSAARRSSTSGSSWSCTSRSPTPRAPYVAHPSALTATAIGISAAATLVLGIVPGPVLDLARVAGQFIR